MRYTVAAFGDRKAGKLVDDPGAARRLRQDSKKAILAFSSAEVSLNRGVHRMPGSGGVSASEGPDEELSKGSDEEAAQDFPAEVRH